MSTKAQKEDVLEEQTSGRVQELEGAAGVWGGVGGKIVPGGRKILEIVVVVREQIDFDAPLVDSASMLGRIQGLQGF